MLFHFHVVGYQGKIITAAGASAGIDMALQLAALITDETTAQAVQLLIEYDPQPPYDTGSMAKAGPILVARARLLVQSQKGHSERRVMFFQCGC